MKKNNIIILLDKLFQSKNMQRVRLTPTMSYKAEDLPTISYADFKKNSLYIVHVLEIEELNHGIRQKEIFHQLYEYSPQMGEYVFVLYIFLVKEDGQQGRYIDWQLSDPDSKIFESVWLIDAQTDELIIPQNQVKSFLGLENEIPRMINYGEIPTYHVVERPKKKYVTYGFIIINLFIWILQGLMGGSQVTDVLIRMGAMNPKLVLYGEWYRLFTAMFLHVGFPHLLMNSIGIYIFGSRLEQKITHWEMVVVYLLGGVLANVVSLVYHLTLSNYLVVAAGASGAVYALTGAILVVAYLTRKRVGGLDAYSILIYFAIGLFSGAMEINIDMAAHIGGFIAGGIIMAVIMQRHKKIV